MRSFAIRCMLLVWCACCCKLRVRCCSLECAVVAVVRWCCLLLLRVIVGKFAARCRLSVVVVFLRIVVVCCVLAVVVVF